MLSIVNIRLIAKYEVKILLRSWFFRIFAGIAILFLFFFNLAVYNINNGVPWILEALPSSMAYANLLFINVVQAIIAIFLGSEFLKQDKKNDTVEVIYARSMTNADYIIGKTLGLLGVFLVLNIIIMILTLAFSFSNTDSSFLPIVYLYYPLLISVPTLVFIFGLSFLFMVILRNQAITFILLLGYIALTLFYLNNKLHHIFDYIAYYVPMMYSDFTGFGDFQGIVIHRGIYFFLGLGFIFTTIVLMKRLPQSKNGSKLFSVLSVICIIIGLLFSYKYLAIINKKENLQKNMVELNNRLFDAPHISIEQCFLDLTHSGKQIDVKAKLIVKNNKDVDIDKYIFSLNPGLIVSKIACAGQNIEFSRNLHIITIIPQKKLPPNAIDSLAIFYKGNINEDACYLDYAGKKDETNTSIMIFRIQKRYAFLQSNYVCLTSESLWYPLAGVTYSSDHPEVCVTNFTKYKLNVTTSKKLMAISQGKPEQVSDGKYSFTPETPLPKISLLIGNYEKRSVTVDSVDYNLITLKGHDYFTKYFNEIGDTLPVIIRDIKQNYEALTELSYMFNRLTFVEVPIQFLTNKHLWASARDAMQPEMILLPEKGALIHYANFKKRFVRLEDNLKDDNEVILESEKQARIFKNFVESNFTIGRGRSSEIEDAVGANTYRLFPQYYTFVNNIHSDEWPVISICFESFLKERVHPSEKRMFYQGLSDQEEANIVLNGKSLSQFISNSKNEEKLEQIINLKGVYLFSLIQNRIGTQELNNLIKELLTNNKFKNLDYKDFVSAIMDRYQVDINQSVKTWYNSDKLAGFLIADVDGIKVQDGDRIHYQIIFNISNPEPVEGLFIATVQTGGGRPERRGRFRASEAIPDVTRVVYLPPSSSKRVGIILDQKPVFMNVNTLISQNIPSVIQKNFKEFSLDKSIKPYNGDTLIEYFSTISEKNDIIVDNEDEGFVITQTENSTFLKRFFNQKSDDQKYHGIRSWRPPKKWLFCTSSNFYGKYIRSAVYTRADEGTRKVSWNVLLKDDGYYDVYYHYGKTNYRFRRRSDKDRKDRSKYYLNVHHDDGIEDVEIELANLENGWNLLGTYYLSADSTKVEQTNKSNGRMVFVDAIKWVKQK